MSKAYVEADFAEKTEFNQHDQRAESLGPLGHFPVNNLTPTLDKSHQAGLTGAGDGFIAHYGEYYAAADKNEIDHLVSVTRGEVERIASFHDGRRALAHALSAAESTASGMAHAFLQEFPDAGGLSE